MWVWFFFFLFIQEKFPLLFFFFPPGNRAGQQAGAGSDVGARPGDGAPRSRGCRRGGSGGTWDRCPPRQRGRAWQGTAQGGDSGRGRWAGRGEHPVAPTAKVAHGGQGDRHRAPLSPGRAASHRTPSDPPKPWGKNVPSLPTFRIQRVPRLGELALGSPPAPLGCRGTNNPLAHPGPRLWLRSSRCGAGTGRGAKAGGGSPWGQGTAVPGGMERLLKARRVPAAPLHGSRIFI